VFTWQPLADMILGLCPDEAAPCKYWHTNDGGGLDAEASIRLAEALERMLSAGEVSDWIRLRDASLAALPNEPCKWCNGTGVRTDKIGAQFGHPSRVVGATTTVKGTEIPHPRAGQAGWCNACDGRGWSRPLSTSYTLDENEVRDFVAFLRSCGGFEIW
jgi:hypothetical protein